MVEDMGVKATKFLAHGAFYQLMSITRWDTMAESYKVSPSLIPVLFVFITLRYTRT
jgi:hypothetical protein